MTGVTYYFIILIFVIGINSPVLAQADDEPVPPQRGNTLYPQNDQPAQNNPYVEKVKLMLEDPNQIRQRLEKDPELLKSLASLTKEGKNEDERWIIRRERIKAAFANAARNLVEKDYAWIAKVAKAEDANQISNEIKGLQNQWKTRFSRISREIREAMRAENTTGQTDRTARSRGRRGAQEESGRAGRRSTREERGTDGSGEPEEISPAEAEENAFVESWASTGDDKTDTLYTEMEGRVVEELARVRETAESLGKTRTVNAIDGVLLMRKERSERTIAAYQQKMQERQGEDTGAATMEDTRRGRGRRGQTDGANDTGRRRR